MQTTTDRLFTSLVNFVQRHAVPLGVRMRMKRRARTVPPPTEEMTALLAGIGVPVDSIWWGPMTLAPVRTRYVIREIESRPPRRVLEVGSGSSTPILAALAKKYGFEFYSLENHAGSAAYVNGLLVSMNLQRYAKLIVVGFRRRKYPDGKSYWWYDVDVATLGGPFDLIVIDGPMGTLVGRNGTIPEVRDHLTADCRIYLDDAVREHEKKCLAEWQRYFPDLVQETPSEAPVMAKVGFTSGGITTN